MAGRNSSKDRETCLERHGFQWNGQLHVKCHVCALLLNVATRKWEADHIRRFAEGGDGSAENLFPICVPCHRKKSAQDTSEIAKGKRVSKRHYGIKRAKGFHRPPGTKFNWETKRYERS